MEDLFVPFLFTNADCDACNSDDCFLCLWRLRKVHFFPDLLNGRETGGLNICEGDSLSTWKGLLQTPKDKLFYMGALATLFFSRLERIPYSKRYHWVVTPPVSLDEASLRECGDQTLKELEEKYKGSIVPPNSPQSIRVNSILKEIVEAMHSSLRMQNSGKWKTTRFATEHLDGMQWKVVLVDSTSQIGAASHTTGTIVVYTSFLGILQSDAEVATVLAHEVGHGLARHSVEDLARCLHTVTFLPMLMFIPHSEIPLALVFSFCSRRKEMEADYIGMMLMASAGYDPRLAPIVYESRLECSNNRGIFATHPPLHERAKKLKKPKVMKQAMAIYSEVASANGVRSSI